MAAAVNPPPANAACNSAIVALATSMTAIGKFYHPAGRPPRRDGDPGIRARAGLDAGRLCRENEAYIFRRSPPMTTAPEPAAPIPVTLLTGFLGSGKTTVLNHVLKAPGMAATAVIVNEFGEIGLDHLLVEKSSDDVVLLNSGCLCCTVRSDIVDTLLNLFTGRASGKIPDFVRVVIETTGLADPAPILHTLISDPLVAQRYALDGVVTTVDAANGAGTLDRQPEAVK